MPILNYGYYKPSLKDQADIVFPAMETNWQLVNDHTHDGITSSLINATTILPAQAGNSGKVLTTDGSNVSWVVPPTAVPELPDQTGNGGKILSTDGSTPSWITVPTEIPDQTGNTGKFLTTDGSIVSWATITIPPAELPDQTGNGGKLLTTDGSVVSWTSSVADLEITGNPVFNNAFIALYGNNAGGGANFSVFGSQGTYLAPTASTSGNNLFFLGARGHDGTSYNAGSKVAIQLATSEAHTPTANGTQITLATTSNGTTTRKNRVRVQNDGALTLFGDTSGSLSLKPAAVTNNHTWNLPVDNAAGVLTNDGSGNLSWAASSSGANTLLSNLTEIVYNPSGGLQGTQINKDLVFEEGNPLAIATFTVQTSDHYYPITNSTARTKNLQIRTGYDGFGSSGDLILGTGGAFNLASRGKIKLQDGTQGTIGHVWTQTAADGSGAWQAPSGGGGLPPFSQHFNSSAFTPTTTTVNNWASAPTVATLTMTGSFAINDEVIIKLNTLLTLFSPSGTGVRGGTIAIFDHNNNLVWASSARWNSGTSVGDLDLYPISAEKRFTFVDAPVNPVFTLKIRQTDVGTDVQCGQTTTGSGGEITHEFWAFRNN